MSAEPQRTCRSCGNEFSGAMEFCPVCMLRKGLSGGIESGESSTADRLELKPVEPAQRFDHYELVKGEDGKPVELGRGAMGVTYKAFDINLGCPVTLKVISERYLGDELARLRFLREARAAASVRHPNVASVFHLGRTGENYFYAMEFVEGETLEKLIKRSGLLEVKLALEIAMQVAAGLAAIHEQNLVHRDIKPTNIIVRLKEERSVTAKIIDLGLAKTLEETASEAGISSPGAFVGTPEFASPEQFGGVGVDIRSDLYSLGVTLWVMVTGKTPFRGLSAEVMYQHQHAPLPLERLKDVPQPVVVLLEKLLEKDPAQRFRTPNELLKAIATITGAIDAGRRITRQRLGRAERSSLLKKDVAGDPQSPSEHTPLGEGKAGLDAKRPAMQTAPRGETPDTRRGLAALSAGVAALLILAAAGGWYVLGGRLIKPAQAAHLSVVVLPFTNLSGDPSQDYFADGVTENLTTDLSRIRNSFVIARNTAFTYKGKAIDAKAIGKELGVRYVLEGSVQRDQNRVRANAQLIDAESGATIWADRFEADMADLFKLQDQVVAQLANALRYELGMAEAAKASNVQNPDAIDLAMRGWALLPSSLPSKDQVDAARPLFEQALKIDPDNSEALAGKAQTTIFEYVYASTADTMTQRSSAWSTERSRSTAAISTPIGPKANT